MSISSVIDVGLTKILAFLLILSLYSIVLFGTATAFLDLELKVEDYNEDRYEKMVILQNIMALDLREKQIKNIHELYREDEGGEPYRYQRQTSLIPMEFFTEKSGKDVGYQKNGENCYFSGVPLLDGQEYGFYVKSYGEMESDPDRELPCNEVPDNAGDEVAAPSLLIRKAYENPRLPVRVAVYDIE